MKSKLRYSLVAVTLCHAICAQQKTLALENGGIASFYSQVFVYGVVPGTNKLKIYRISNELQPKDSILLDGPAGATVLRPVCDTLHGFLNLALFEQEKNTAMVYRLDKDLHVVHTIKNVNAARFNNRQITGENCLQYKDFYYCIKTTEDTAGKQFYLNKYQLKSAAENFDYQQVWQFPFERRNVVSAKVIHADKLRVTMLVHVQGEKKGQWLLCVSASKGHLIKAQKLNRKDESVNYELTAVSKSSNGSLFFAGCKTAQNDPLQQKLFVCVLDTFSNIVERQEFPPEIAPMSNKKERLIFKVTSITEEKDRRLALACDVFKKSATMDCFLYSNHIAAYLQMGEDQQYRLTGLRLSPNNVLEEFSNSPGSRDVSAQSCPELKSSDPVSQIEAKVRLSQKADENANHTWLLLKHNPAKKQQILATVAPEKKVYKLKNLRELPLAQFAGLIVLSNSVIVASQEEADRLTLTNYNW